MQRVAEIAAWAGIHRCHKHEGGGECDGILGTRDVDDAVFERLAQYFEHGTRELWQLVEEEDSVVCEAYLAGLRVLSAAYKGYL